MSDRSVTTQTAAVPTLGLLLNLKLKLLRNRLRQLTDQTPLQLLLIILFIGTIWGGLYLIFDHVFVFMGRFQEQAAIAIPYVFHIFFAAMTVLLAFSTAILVYGALFSREEPAFLLAAPNPPRNVVAVMYLEALFFASWSLILLGIPLMLAIGQAQGLPWHFYPTFILAFLGFVPIPGAIGLLGALCVAMFAPRRPKRIAFIVGGALLALLVVWWGRLWDASALHLSQDWISHFLGELRYVKAAMLPSSWVAKVIQLSIEDQPAEAAFYLGVTFSTSIFVSWWANVIAARWLLLAFGRAHSAPNMPRRYSGWASRCLTRVAFFYLPANMRALILKDVRNFLRDPMQWSQLVILFGLLSLYLFYLPRSRPEGFTVQWQALICFLNYGAVTLILSTFTSRFVFPMISIEGRQIWLVGLWPLSRDRVILAKFLYALTLTAIAAMSVTALSIRALHLPLILAATQGCATFATCIGLCGLAIGLGARLPNFREDDVGRIASGVGGTVNLIASVGLVALSVGLFGAICLSLVRAGSLEEATPASLALFVALIGLSLATAVASMAVGRRAFRTQQF